MKKIILLVFLVTFSLGAFSISAYSQSQSENPAVPANKENRMSDEETNNLTKRAEEVRGADKSKQVLVVQENHRSRRGHDDMNGYHRGHGGIIFIGGGSVVLLIILIIILV
jgi:hypothetical protein